MGGEARIWLIAGPTASGKSALALRLAEKTGGEIVNADSMQLYAELRILTARPSREDEARAPHHLYGLADAADAWSVGRWLRATLEILGAIAERGRPAIVVGGTGLYFRALTRGLATAPAIPMDVRGEARERYDRLGGAAFSEELTRIDPVSAARISPGDRQRLTRAWEVWAASGRPLSDWNAATEPPLAVGSWRGIVLDPPRDTLYERCNDRLAAMRGAIEEVAALVARDLDPSLPAMKALGLAAFAAQLRGELTQGEALALAQAQTRRYAKRQTTWFRHQAAAWPRIWKTQPEDLWRAMERSIVGR